MDSGPVTRERRYEHGAPDPKVIGGRDFHREPAHWIDTAPPTLEQRRRAALVACSYATDGADARQLLEALGLDDL